MTADGRYPRHDNILRQIWTWGCGSGKGRDRFYKNAERHSKVSYVMKSIPLSLSKHCSVKQLTIEGMTMSGMSSFELEKLTVFWNLGLSINFFQLTNPNDYVYMKNPIHAKESIKKKRWLSYWNKFGSTNLQCIFNGWIELLSIHHSTLPSKAVVRIFLFLYLYFFY